MAKLEERLDRIQTTVTVHSGKLDDLKSNANRQDERLLAMETTCAKLTASNDKLAAKVIDLESRSRRNNIRVLGLPESIEGLQPTTFFSKMLAEIFGDILDSSPECDRAHRSLSQKLEPGQRPRPVIIRLHKFQAKEKIIRKARSKRGKLKYLDNPIFIYEDYAPEVVEQRHQTVR